MAKYRKKPVVIEAVQFCDDSFETTEKLQNLGLDPIRIGYENKEPVLKIETLNGLMTASVGDWVIKGVNGEFYPCKPDIFTQTYESA
jgi:hypothetical protein